MALKESNKNRKKKPHVTEKTTPVIESKKLQLSDIRYIGIGLGVALILLFIL